MLLCRFNVTSRKLTTCLFASMVMCSPLRLNIWQISFSMFSVCLGVALIIGHTKTNMHFTPIYKLIYNLF